MASEWYCQLGETGLLGPLGQHDLVRLAREGKLRPAHLVRKNLDGQWIPARNVKGLFVPDSGVGRPDDPLSQKAMQVFDEVRAWRPAARASMSSHAQLSLRLGLASIVLSFLAGIPAVIAGIMALGDINSHSGKLAGLRQASIGIALGLATSAAAMWWVPAVLERLPSRQRSWQAESERHLLQIAAALDSYHEEYGAYPPAYVLGPDKKPWHSWRVLILPYLGESPKEMLANRRLYAEYKFDEPWDGPANWLLASRMPADFAAPNAADSSQVSAYAVVVGPGTAWPGSKSGAADRMPDGRKNTALVVEAVAAEIPWMAPRDLAFEELNPAINGPDPNGLSSPLDGGALVLFADGKVRLLPDTLDSDSLRAIFTTAGNEPIYVQ